jgi:chitin disaccharide deacetylase
VEARRVLIVNADDFGRSPGVNRGIIEAFEDGIVTSASLMVRWPAAAEAAVYARAHPSLSVGLHVDLSEWVYANEEWSPVYQVVPDGDPAALAEEVARQVAWFRELLGRDPTHLDSHQHVHRSDPGRSVLVNLAAQLGIPLRECDPRVRYAGDFYGQSGKGDPLPEYIGVDALLGILHDLPPGITELGCHPGDGTDLDSTYAQERLIEVRTLCDPRVRTALEAERIILHSYHDLVG